MRSKDLDELNEFLEPKKSEIMDIWDMEKDGKVNWEGTDFEDKAFRK